MKEFNKAFGLLKILRASDVLDYVSSTEELPFAAMALNDEVSEVSFIKRTQELWRENSGNLRAKANDADKRVNPILHRLKGILLETFKDPEARGIVLVEMRYSTEALIKFIGSDPALSSSVRPVKLVGQMEMSDGVVKENLNSFRSGENNLLIATDIAQEGLDIPQCNFVIRR